MKLKLCVQGDVELQLMLSGGCLIIPGSMHMFLPLSVLIMTSHDLCQLWLKTTTVA